MKKILMLMALFAIIFPLPSLAFNEDYIISDKELEDYNSMTYQEIQSFMLEKDSFLAYYADFWPENGTFMSASEIIWRTSQKFKINPQVILTLLEKEQSLLAYQIPSQKRLDWAMGYAVCDNCYLAHPLVAKYRGFAKQVYYAAERMRDTFLADLKKHGRTHTGFGPGISKKVDGKYWITPQNNATALFYTYTPHLNGNKNFYKIWQKWFSNLEIVYPDGSLLQNSKTGGIYMIQNGAKRPFVTKTAFSSRYSDEQVIPVGPGLLEKYPNGAPIKFANYSLLEDAGDTFYLVQGDILRPFDSKETFRSLGFSPFELENASAEDIASYKIGTPITQNSAYPTGALLQDKETGGIYWVIEGTKHPIWDKSILVARFSQYKIIQVDRAELNKFETGEPVKFTDGALIKGQNDPAVYFVSAGMLRPIPSEDVFLAYNWRWEDIIWTSDKVLSLYENGLPILLTPTESYEL